MAQRGPFAESNRYGINIGHWYEPPGTPRDAGRKQVAALVADAGIGWVRMDVAWEWIQRDGQNFWDWTLQDTTYARATALGLNVVAAIAHTPRWASPHVDHQRHNPETAWPQYEHFVDSALKRYPLIKYWSIWNEPNSGNDCGYYCEGPVGYNELIAHAAPVVHAAGRKVVGLEVIGPDPNIGNWLRTVLGPGGQGSNIDVVAVHSYNSAANIRSFVEGLRQSSGVSPWPWEIWLTEVGLIENAPSDSAAVSHLTDIITAMDSRVEPLWTKTFYWHSHIEAEGPGQGDNRGIIRGANAGAAVGKPQYFRYKELISKSRP